MKNYLVLLVTIGIGVAYWYQIPDPVPPPPEKPVVEAKATPAPTPFIAVRSALENPASQVGGGHTNSSVLLGDDNNKPRRQ